jgi:hypothetical protein
VISAKTVTVNIHPTKETSVDVRATGLGIHLAA